MSEVNLPEGWVTATVADINDYKSSNMQPKSHIGTTFELYSVPIFPEGKPEILQAEEIGSSKQFVSENDVLVCKINPRINRVWRVASAQNLGQIASSEWIVVRQKRLNTQYLTWYFQSEDFRTRLCADVTGVGGSLTRAQPKQVAKFTLPLPPLAEQKVIADKLDTLLAQVETTKARLDRIPNILKRFRQSVLAAAVSGKLTEEWREFLQFATKKGALCDFVSIDIGHAFKSKEFTDSGVKLLRGQNIEPGALKWDETRYFPIEKLEEHSNLFIRANDIILAMDRPIISTGLKLARAKEKDLPCVLVQRVARFTKFDGLQPDYLFLLLRDIAFSNYIQPNQTGSDIPHISGRQILAYEIQVPSIEEQTEIVRRVEELFAFADRIEEKANAALERVNNLTQSILAKAFRGELTADWRATNPDLISGDNSAEALLAKIKAERAATKPVKKKRQ
ncbi:type I restriction enzyme, S subunit [Oceanospirillum multiglobuliferum]|uniref:Type I restriction endonuclease subunit S n=1 Tax=Oceanospirillum multiglobuliferum TaxID=64969 RepID=A0A1T4NF52_9GAMM|nr:restriction endonuclease subunit S [Oceanospirillum multiglobuliferum]OPX55943.1 type I restriction endonuclease subunit S [Oceanospirillum multiglobuliferum]SJZ77743.1 type I restriction enzyme, S subunit [Oceanospirillum multiglobuliferum]